MKIPRLPWEKYWMLLAHLTATRSTCDRGPELLFDPGRHGVGAVLVKNRRAIAGGYNGSAPGQPHCDDPEDYIECVKCGSRDLKEVNNIPVCCCAANSGLRRMHGGHIMRDGHCVRTIHSEMNALMQCALDGVSPQGATLYSTASPCFDCAKNIIRAGIIKVYYGQAYDSRYGLSGDVSDMLLEAGIETEELVITREDLDGS
jgi:dCMP deaminase